MTRILYILLLLAAAHHSFGQQDPLYAQYISNPMLFNPAYNGLNNAFNANVSYRNQWAGFAGNPVTINANAHMSAVDNKLGIGVMIVQDKVGTAKTNEVHLGTSYKIDFNEKVLSFGMQVGFVNLRNNYSDLRIDPDAVFAQNLNIIKPNVGFGAILKSNKVMIGLSVPRMLKAKEAIDGANFQIYNQHLYLFGSYVHYIGTRLRLKPSVLLRGVQGAPISADVNFNLQIDTKYTAGIYTRNLKSYGAIFQVWFLEKFRFGYAFELPSNGSVGPQFTSHEVTIGIKTAILNSHDRSYSEF